MRFISMRALVLGLALGSAALSLSACGHSPLTRALTGGAIGFFSGYGLPMLLHYWKRPLGEVVSRDDLKIAVTPGAGGNPLGAQIVGIF